MLSYKEFLEVTRSYRRQVEESHSSRKDEEYELARSQSELEILRLSRTTDPKDLARILTYVDKFIAELQLEPSYDLLDSIKISTLFTYFKIIAQHSGYAATVLDDIYDSDHISYKASTGGIIFSLKSNRENLPRVRCKVPIEATPGRIRTIIHETFVAFAALNPLRRAIPSFSYVYTFWECGGLVDVDKTLYSGLCLSPGSRPVMIYEYNPGAIPLYDRMRDASSLVELNNILDYLLQLMGALELANEYADYTHYDLHSGNVLVQPQSEEIHIKFQGYDLRTRERVIIIDNGLAYCAYGKRGVPNSDAIQLFGSREKHGIKDYGSTRNAVLGVQHDGPYPLGDVFRIFFDIYSLCSRELQGQLRPLVAHFFSDVSIDQKIEGDLPPFKEEMYKYRYVDFAKLIFQHYQLQFVKPRSMWLGIPTPAPGVRLDEVFNWKIVNPDYVPTTYEIGMISLLDNSLTFGEPPVETPEDTLQQIRHLEGAFLRDVLYDADWVQMKEFDQESVTVEEVLHEGFRSRYTHNVRGCVDHIMWIRAIYSNARALFFALKKMGDKDPLGRIAKALDVQSSELETLATYCKKARLPSYTKDMFHDMLSLTRKIEDAIRGAELGEDGIWYRACIPAIIVHLEFGVEWGKVPASFGQLSLPDIESP